jgi:hypothetical protein
MSKKALFPDLTGWEPTRDTLHSYSQAVGVIPRAHAEFHPKWWHISLKVQPDGLVTDAMPLPDGGIFLVKLDVQQHKALVVANSTVAGEVSLSNGLTGTEFGDRLLAIVADLGLTADYARDKFESDESRAYDPAMAAKYLTTLVNTDRIFNKHIANLSGDVGQVQLWPHHFDLAVEWFGTRVVEYQEGDEVQEYPSQLNLGLSPGDSGHPAPYFYSNPWPFEKDKLLSHSLPKGARWFTEGWEGSILPYAELVGDADAEERLLAYARAVYQAAAPTLTA